MSLNLFLSKIEVEVNLSLRKVRKRQKVRKSSKRAREEKIFYLSSNDIILLFYRHVGIIRNLLISRRVGGDLNLQSKNEL